VRFALVRDVSAQMLYLGNPYDCLSTASLRVWPHSANARRIRCQAHLNTFPLGELEETTGTPLYYVDEDYPAGPGIIEPLPE